MNKTDLNDLGYTEEELFSPVDHSQTESEKITAPRYSYWKSVFRVFFRNKLNIIILSLLIFMIPPSPITTPLPTCATPTPST